MSAMSDVLAVFARSDLAPGLDPLWYRWTTVTCNHVLLGILLSLLPLRAALAVLCAWVVKELAFDLPNGAWAALVWLDSAGDILAGFAGWQLGQWLQSRRGITRTAQGSYQEPSPPNQRLDPHNAPEEIKGSRDGRP